MFAESVCTNTNFKMADLRGASFEKARLSSTNFEGAKVYSVSLAGAHIENIPESQVDISEKGDGSQLIAVRTWLDSIKDDSHS